MCIYQVYISSLQRYALIKELCSHELLKVSEIFVLGNFIQKILKVDVKG